MNGDQKVNSEELMAEYDQLRKEILQNDNLTLQVITVVLLITSALMGFAFSDQITDDRLKATLFYLVESIAFIGLVQNIDRVQSTLVIGSYIKNFIEPKATNVKWETRLSDFRRRRVKYGDIEFIRHQRLIYLIIIATNFLLGSYFLVQAFYAIYPQFVSIAITLGLLLTVAYLVILWRRYNLLNSRSTELFDQTWKDIKDKEDEDNSKDDADPIAA